MYRKVLLALSILLLGAGASASVAQEWRPPTRQMPIMPSMAELSGDWLGPRADWFAGTAAISGVQPSALQPAGEARPGTTRTQVVRFNSGPLPVVVWQDRNGDDLADIIEIYHGGGVSVQLIDADYDGRANVLRMYDTGGTLIREDRL